MALFPSIRIEGGLLGPDTLEQLVSSDLPGQSAKDFGLDGKRNLTDEIAAAFADARALWGVFQHRLDRLPEQDSATTVTRDAWVVPFLGLLGYELRYNAKAYDVDGLLFAISHRAGESEESPPVHIVGARQELGRVAASGKPRLAPHSLVQEYLNRTEPLWGIVTNGRTLRLLRDCTFVRRQAYVEFDLPGILDEQRFQDFVALYRLLHRTRLPRDVDDISDCLLEKYYQHSEEQGGRVRDHLRDGVEQCITMLANGFLRHPANDELRRRVSPGCTGNERITADNLYRQLLTLVYRFLFLIVSEDRGLLSPDPLYRDHYSIGRLRWLLDERSSFTNHDDLWQSLRVLWLIFIKDQTQPALNNQPMAASLGLPVLNGDLFAPQDLDGFTISNRDLLEAFWYLAWYQEKSGQQRRVNYAALDVEELGSVYESLLDFHPTVDLDHAGRPIFSFLPGSQRKRTGSYYTPPELVAELIKSTVDPVLEHRLKPLSTSAEREEAILTVRICDPACGSGHFLLAAARRLGKELARVRTGEDEPAPERVREAVRDVIAHCIYGVDKNQLAVDLCRVALWLEGHAAAKPLTFLNHRIRPGDSLVGVFDLEVVTKGIPDEAFKPLKGDDKEMAKRWKAANTAERLDLEKGQQQFVWDPVATLNDWTRHSRNLEAIADDSPAAIRQKKDLFKKSHADPAWLRQKEACDLWTAAFFQPLQQNKPIVSTGVIADHLSGRPVDPRITGAARVASEKNQFFHWPLEFPEVFTQGGFDVMLGNPPWERVKLQEQEFFATRDARIATAKNKAARTKLIKQLPGENPELHSEFVDALRAAGGASSAMRHGGRFPLTGRGDINTYAVFAELASNAINGHGRAGMILPTGIATDDTTKYFFNSVVQNERLVDLIGFENEAFIFPAVHHAFKFCKMTVAGEDCPIRSSRIAFFIRRFTDLSDDHRFFSFAKTDFTLVNPNTGNCPIFRTQADAELTKAIYRRVPVLWREATHDQLESNPWRLSFKTLFHMSNDSHHFRLAEELEADGYRLEGNVFVSPYDRYLPLYEAKMVHQFDHRYSTYAGATQKQLNVGILPQPTAEEKVNSSFVVQPRYWVREEVVESAIPKYPDPLAMAVRLEHRESIQRVLLWWAAGFYLAHNDDNSAARLLLAANKYDIEHTIAKTLSLDDPPATCRQMQEAFPLTGGDAAHIEEHIAKPENEAHRMLERFSPKWLIGWRNICRATDERTFIASVLPVSAVGNSFTVVPMPGIPPEIQLNFVVIANSFAVDYAARNKIGGMNINFFFVKQFPILPRTALTAIAGFDRSATLHEWFLPRALELSYTAEDLAPLAKACGIEAGPYSWNDRRRFEIRCELDAAMFHLYLPADMDGSWRRVEGESTEQLAGLVNHFCTPRDAVTFILDQFPITRDRDQTAYGTYRTKNRILEIYDAMLAAQQARGAYRSSLDPPPGTGLEA